MAQAAVILGAPCEQRTVVTQSKRVLGSPRHAHQPRGGGVSQAAHPHGRSRRLACQCAPSHAPSSMWSAQCRERDLKDGNPNRPLSYYHTLCVTTSGVLG